MLLNSKNKKHRICFVLFFCFFFFRGNFTYLLNFGYFCKYPPTFKTSHLGVSKFGFLSLCPFHTKNPNAMPILSLTLKLKLHHFRNSVVLELGVKLVFFVRNGKCERKSKFDIPKQEFLNIGRMFAKTRKFITVSEVFLFFKKKIQIA
jgi:hypothetical protein